jgi:hypothetical protein
MIFFDRSAFTRAFFLSASFFFGFFVRFFFIKIVNGYLEDRTLGTVEQKLGIPFVNGNQTDILDFE